MIVDDVPENLHVLMETFKEEYSIVAAKSGEKALQMAEFSDPQPDIILLDVIMPDMDGYEVCLKLKSNPRTWDIPVLFVTALTNTGDEARGLAVGGVDFITKPFQPDLVKARVRSHLELRSHRDQLEELVSERTHELNKTQDATIFLLANLAETRDPETGGHIKRTQTYVYILAEYLKKTSKFKHLLDETTIKLMCKSAPLHDIGKVGVPDHILLKPGKLTPQEFEEMKKHCLYGFNALRSLLLFVMEKHLEVEALLSNMAAPLSWVVAFVVCTILVWLLPYLYQ